MELPAWRWPNWRHFALGLWERVRAFIGRAGTIIFAMTVVIWALVSFPGEGINESYAGQIGRLFQPLFAPLGFTWEMCIALIPGMAAREVVVAALGTVYAVGAETEEALQGALSTVVQERWGLAVAFSFLAWYVLAPMCIAMLATIKREMNSWRTTAAITGALFALAYAFAFIVYRLTLGVAA